MLVFFGGLLEAQDNMRFEGLEKAQFNLIRQNCLHMGLEYRAGEQCLTSIEEMANDYYDLRFRGSRSTRVCFQVVRC